MNANMSAEALALQLSHTRKVRVPVTAATHRLFDAERPSLSADLLDRLRQPGPEYDAEIAYALSVMSGWCYSDAETLARKMPYYGLPEGSIQQIAVTNPAMFVVASAFFFRSACGRVGILAFRGTEPDNAVSWLTDADVVQRNLGEGLVHQGFYLNLRAIWDELADSFSDALGPNAHGERERSHATPPAALESLYLTGHSLGGAMAVLAAAKLTADFPTLKNVLKGVYTFGQPAVGDRAFVDQFAPSFGDRLFRHNFGRDLIPRLPPAWNGRYVHFGVLRATANPKQPWAKQLVIPAQIVAVSLGFLAAAASFVTRRLPALERLMLPYSLDDHCPTRYIEASRAALKAQPVGAARDELDRARDGSLIDKSQSVTLKPDLRGESGSLAVRSSPPRTRTRARST